MRRKQTNTDRYSAKRRAGKLHGTVRRAVLLRGERDRRRVINDPLAVPLARRHEAAKRTVPITVFGTPEIERLRSMYPQRRNWNAAEATAGRSRVETIDEGQYSRRCTYRHYTYTPLVQSYAVVVRGAVYWHFDGNRERIPAPRGYRWGADANGVYLASRSNPRAEYHPTAEDMISGAKTIVARLKEAYRTRCAVARKSRQQIAAVRRAEREGATVCLRDSLRAGNCLAGSAAWAQRHGLDARKHYRPSEVLALANGDASRVALVVTVALRRHREEMERGFALLTEHRN